MSEQTWLEEFYPIPALEAAKQGERVALEHSIQKWKGATGENLAKHGLQDTPRVALVGYDDGCALCVLHNYIGRNDACRGCCAKGCHAYLTEWHCGDPLLMIEHLETARYHLPVYQDGGDPGDEVQG